MRVVQRFAPILHLGEWQTAFWGWDEYMLSPLDYEKALHRVGAYWVMGESVISPREAALARLDANP
jgi:hypothetical protein